MASTSFWLVTCVGIDGMGFHQHKLQEEDCESDENRRERAHGGAGLESRPADDGVDSCTGAEDPAFIASSSEHVNLQRGRYCEDTRTRSTTAVLRLTVPPAPDKCLVLLRRTTSHIATTR